MRARWRYFSARHRVRRRALLTGSLLVAAAGVWIVVTALAARGEATQVRDALDRVRVLVAQGDLPAARRVAADIPASAERLHRLTTGPAWWAAAQIPYLGEPVAELRDATAAMAQVGSEAVPALVDVSRSLDPARLRVSGDTVDLAALVSVRPRLSTAARVLAGAVHRMDATPSATWIPAIDERVSQLASVLHQVNGYVSAASRAADVLPQMLGADGPKRFFVGLQNEAEMRGTGGLPGAFAIAVADHGRVRFTEYASDQAIIGPPRGSDHIATGLDFGAGYARAYGNSDPTTSFQNSNVSPQFPYAARIWAAMWQKISGEHVDGVIALDPSVLADLLAVTGPVPVPQGLTVTAGDVVSLTQRDQYTLFPDNDTRKQFLVDVLKATAERVTAGAGSALGLARAVTASAAQQRFQVWFADPAVEAVLAQTSYAGALPTGNRPLAAPVLNNEAAGKLDYYLQRTLDYNRSGCGATRDVRVTITLTNTAPASGLPAYVTTRLDSHPGVTVHPGDTRSLLDYYATAGARLQSITIDGRAATASVLSDLGHPIFRLDLELPRGSTTTIVLHLSEPGGTGDPVIWRQPGVTPLAVSAYSQPCGS
ncbi:MAG: DUF4012 domain-containing protein [Jatrophihabitans sp.]|nr:MAG: DUF4012 domain-containing protein [Jatrophihabitans sp.]